MKKFKGSESSKEEKLEAKGKKTAGSGKRQPPQTVAKGFGKAGKKYK